MSAAPLPPSPSSSPAVSCCGSQRCPMPAHAASPWQGCRDVEFISSLSAFNQKQLSPLSPGSFPRPLFKENKPSSPSLPASPFDFTFSSIVRSPRSPHTPTYILLLFLGGMFPSAPLGLWGDGSDLCPPRGPLAGGPEETHNKRAHNHNRPRRDKDQLCFLISRFVELKLKWKDVRG